MFEEVTTDALLDWDVLRGEELVRHTYSVADISIFPFNLPNVEECDVKPDVLNYAYYKGVMWHVNRCQEYYYFGIGSSGSVVCKTCLPAARYALFSVHSNAYINKLHVHASMLVNCLHCNRRIPSVAIGKCNISDCDFIESVPMYKCLRIKPVVKK